MAGGIDADHNYFANLIWQIADLLRGPYRPPQYERVMLPMTVLRRFDCVLAPTKAKVLAEHQRRKGGKLNDDALDRLLNKASGQRFHNHSALDFEKLKGDPDNIEKHLVSYIKGFSSNVRRIFDFFEFENEIERMREANILYLVVFKFCDVDLHPSTVPNDQMGLIFENLIRRFNELANETAGDHFTPREVIRLMVNILFINDDRLLSTFDRLSRHELLPGDVVMGRRGELGRCAIVSQDQAGWVCGTGSIRVRPDSRKLHSQWLRWLLAWPGTRDWLSLESVGSTMDNLGAEVVGAMPIPLPSLQQQQAISDYLELKISQLDALVAAKERVLGLLAEKRRALITRAITRGLPAEAAAKAGLNPRAPLRDSEVPWLGEIPASWKTKRLKFLVRRIEQGWSPECHSIPVSENEWGVLKAGCCNGGVFNSQENKSLPLDVDPVRELEVKPGDVLMSRASGSTDLIGSVARVPPGSRGGLLLSDKTYRLRVDTSQVDEDFFVLLLGSDVGRTQVEEVVSGAAGLANNIGQADIKEFHLALPPIDEQRAIVARIAMETARIDAMRSATERTIALLRERRAALIAAAVTGKVRLTNDEGLCTSPA